jgi:hypothetical protein
LVAAGLLSVLFFPTAALTLLLAETGTAAIKTAGSHQR